MPYVLQRLMNFIFICSSCNRCLTINLHQVYEVIVILHITPNLQSTTWPFRDGKRPDSRSRNINANRHDMYQLRQSPDRLPPRQSPDRYQPRQSPERLSSPEKRYNQREPSPQRVYNQGLIRHEPNRREEPRSPQREKPTPSPRDQRLNVLSPLNENERDWRQPRQLRRTKSERIPNPNEQQRLNAGSTVPINGGNHRDDRDNYRNYDGYEDYQRLESYARPEWQRRSFAEGSRYLSYKIRFTPPVAHSAHAWV